MTHQVFERYSTDFAGWHFIRSLWLADKRLEGTVRVRDGVARIDVSCAGEEDTLRILAPGFEPVDIPMDVVLDADLPVVVELISSQ